LSLTCQRLHHLLRTSQKIPVLFAIAERVWGPLEDIYQLLTYNAAQPVHIKRTPVLSLALLTQVSRIGRVAVSYQNFYPHARWDGDNAQLRRQLTPREALALRRALYRIWLYDKAFHTPASPRMMRLQPALVAERCQLLRTWPTDELLEMEDVRNVIEHLVSTELCPTNGDIFSRRGGEVWNKHFYEPSAGRHGPTTPSIHAVFHDSRNDLALESTRHMPASQLRERSMEGWGDEIEQYHLVNSMMKLNPAQIMWLHDHAVTKQDVERYVEEHVGGQWFWNNGETLLHTWLMVLHGRGVAVQEVREKVLCGLAGVAVDEVAE
jgi:hypothetical protein